MTEQVKDLLFPQLTPLSVEILLAWGSGIEIVRPFSPTVDIAKVHTTSTMTSATLAVAIRALRGEKTKRPTRLVPSVERALSNMLIPQGFVMQTGNISGIFKLTKAGRQLTELLHTAIELWYRRNP
jgi:hypothetical protein